MRSNIDIITFIHKEKKLLMSFFGCKDYSAYISICVIQQVTVPRPVLVESALE